MMDNNTKKATRGTPNFGVSPMNDEWWLLESSMNNVNSITVVVSSVVFVEFCEGKNSSICMISLNIEII